MLLFEFDGLLLLRLATRQLEALLFQLPPRLTRFDPDDAPFFAEPENKSRKRHAQILIRQVPFFFEPLRGYKFFFLHLLPFARLCGLFVGGVIFSLRTGTHHAETNAEVRVRRAVAATVSNTTVRSAAAPASTAQDAVRPRRRTRGIGLR